MSEILAIEWDPKCLRGIDALVTGDAIQVRHIFELPQPSGQEQPELREWFAHLLAEKGITTKQVVVVLPRENVVVRRIELPDGPEDELPQMVKFQVASKSSLSLDDVALDYTTLPKREGVATRDVMTSMVQNSVIQAIRQFVEGAQRELTKVTLSPFATAQLACRVEGYSRTDPNHATLLVSRSTDRVEITVTSQGQVIFSHSARLDVEKPEQQNAVILTEISRGWMSFQNLNLPVKLVHGILFGSDQDFPGLAESLQSRLKISVRRVNPFEAVKATYKLATGPTNISSDTPLLGSLLPENQALVQTLNFIAPRKAIVKPDTMIQRRQQIAIAGGVAAVVLLLGYWIGLLRLDSSISAKGEAISSLDDALKKGAPTLASAKDVETWAQEDLNVLDELKRFQSQLPGTDRVYLTKVSLNVPTSKNPGEMRVEGHARDEQDIRKLREKLIAPETGYKISAEEIKSESKEYYPKKLNEQIRLGKPPMKPASTASANAATKSASKSATPTNEAVDKPQSAK